MSIAYHTFLLINKHMNTKIKILLAGLVLTFFACNKLDLQPVSQIVSTNFFKTASDAEAGVIACYDGLQDGYGSHVIFVSGVVSDEALAASGGNNTRHQDFVPTAGQGNVGDHWRNSYFAIHRCIDVIENVPEINDVALDKNRVMGEAYFVRALLYFNLTRFYGKVPLVTQTTKSPEQELKVSREEVGKVYELIIADLLQAKTLLPTNNGTKARASKGAAMALLARVYLHRNQSGDYAAALKECEEVMALTNPKFELVPGANYADLFTVAKQNTGETIFEISYRPGVSQEGHNLDAVTVPASGSTYAFRPEPKIITAFNNSTGDVRKDAALGVFNNITYIKKYQAGPPSITTNRRAQDVNLVVLRLADVILMRAECLNELNRNSEAIPFLDQIRQRAGLPRTTAVSKEEVRLAIENERFLELAFEGHRWFDLVRTKRAQALLPKLTDINRVLWPVPSREIDLNPNLLPQNPSY